MTPAVPGAIFFARPVVYVVLKRGERGAQKDLLGLDLSQKMFK